VGQNSTQPADTFVTRGAGSKVKDEYVYIDIVIDGKFHLALVDTGCQLSLVPPFIGNRPVQPSSEKLYAANGSLIHVHGTVELPVTIGGHHSVVKMLVTSDIREPTFSFAWLSENKVCWDFTHNALFMHGTLIPLRVKKAPQIASPIGPQVGQYMKSLAKCGIGEMRASSGAPTLAQ